MMRRIASTALLVAVITPIVLYVRWSETTGRARDLAKNACGSDAQCLGRVMPEVDDCARRSSVPKGLLQKGQRLDKQRFAACIFERTGRLITVTE